MLESRAKFPLFRRMKSKVSALLLLALLPILPATAANSAAPAPAAASSLEGKVVETMNSAGYTYFQVDTGSRKAWVAATELTLKVGDKVAVPDAMAMANYHSKSLNRTFDLVYFASNVTVNGKPASASVAATTRTTPPIDVANIKRAPGGQTVAEIHGSSAKLAGKTITVRARVVKYNSGILGKNWLHIRDGSGTEGTNDLTITTQARAKVGDLVLVTGVLVTNRDFGSGYKYPLIVEDAVVAVE